MNDLEIINERLKLLDDRVVLLSKSVKEGFDGLKKKGTLIYLASPYSSEENLVRESRFVGACLASALLIKQGKMVFSPIAHSHPIAQHGLGLDWEYWKEFDLKILRSCDALVVLMLYGWEESVGIKAEVDEALRLRLPVTYVTMEELERGV